MLCACACAYGIDSDGNCTLPEAYPQVVGWERKSPPVPVFGGDLNTNACLIGLNTEDGIVVAFRGTLPPFPVTYASIIDWLHDIAYAISTHEGNIPGRVHHGFRDAVETIWPQVIELINHFHESYPDKQLYLTGHSKGGAMASIAAAKIHFDHPDMLQPAAVYTYASPHPGDTDFANSFPLDTIPVIRYENHLDIVPFLPPTEDFIRLVSKIPFVGRIFKKEKGWDYAPLGELQYIKDDHEITGDEPGLTLVRLGDIVAAMIEGEKGLERIAGAHYESHGSGYMTGTCSTDACE
jgi:hypothetical protein